MSTIDPAAERLKEMADRLDRATESATRINRLDWAAERAADRDACRAGAEAVALVERLRAAGSLRLPLGDLIAYLLLAPTDNQYAEVRVDPQERADVYAAFVAVDNAAKALLAAAASPSPIDPPPPADDVALMAVALDHYWTWFGDDCGCPAGSTDGCPIYDGVTAARHLLPGPEGDPDSTPHPAVPVDPAPSSDAPDLAAVPEGEEAP